MENKPFDCVEMKHKGALVIKQKLKGKTEKAQLKYWREQTEKLRARQDELRQLSVEQEKHKAAL